MVGERLESFFLKASIRDSEGRMKVWEDDIRKKRNQVNELKRLIHIEKADILKMRNRLKQLT